MMTEHCKGCAEPEWVCKQRATPGRSTRYIRQRARECAERQSVDSRVEGTPGQRPRPIRYKQYRCGCRERGGDREQLESCGEVAS